MPLYEYQCTACAHRFERIVKFSDAPVTTCPKCGKETAEQMISAPAVQFKGSGWYVTDYARKGSGQASSSSAKSEAASDAASDAASAGKDSSSAKPDAASGSTSGSKGGDSGGSSTKSSAPGESK